MKLCKVYYVIAQQFSNIFNRFVYKYTNRLYIRRKQSFKLLCPFRRYVALAFAPEDKSYIIGLQFIRPLNVTLP